MCRYGVYVLIVEILGAVSTLLYGVNLLWDPVNPPAEADPNNPELPQVQHYPSIQHTVCAPLFAAALILWSMHCMAPRQQ